MIGVAVIKEERHTHAIVKIILFSSLDCLFLFFSKTVRKLEKSSERPSTTLEEKILWQVKQSVSEILVDNSGMCSLSSLLQCSLPSHRLRR